MVCLGAVCIAVLSKGGLETGAISHSVTGDAVAVGAAGATKVLVVSIANCEGMGEMRAFRFILMLWHYGLWQPMRS